MYLVVFGSDIDVRSAAAQIFLEREGIMNTKRYLECASGDQREKVFNGLKGRLRIMLPSLKGAGLRAWRILPEKTMCGKL